MHHHFVNMSGDYLGSYDGPIEYTPDFLSGGVSVPDAPEDARQKWRDGQWQPLDLPPSFEPVSRRKLRLTLVRNEIALSNIEALIAAMPEGLEKQEAEIEWADATEFDRDHPTLLLIAQALNLSKEKVDKMWLEAMAA